jgi:hypothetical protein
MRVQSLRQEIANSDDPDQRTEILAQVGQHPVALFFTGQKHAGENLDQLLKGRAAELSPPLQMCDALARNQSKTFGITKRHCPIRLGAILPSVKVTPL